MATFPDVPASLAPLLVQTAVQTGCPASWLAAACSATGFNKDYQTFNPSGTLNNFGCYVPTRQWGIAGIWNTALEQLLTIPQVGVYYETGSGCNDGSLGPPTIVNAGWTLTFPCFNNCTTYPCSSPQVLMPAANPPFDIQENLNAAALIFNQCKANVLQTFGALNALVFYRYVLGCAYFPQKDPTTGLGIIPNIPATLNDPAWYLVQAQAFYAPQFGETAVVPNPPSTVQCPIGYTWNGLVGKCCNPIGQCISPEVCNGCATYDPVTNRCIAGTCPQCPCAPGLDCVSGQCLAPCVSDSNCVPPQICVDGHCVTPCTANGDCTPPAQCVCSSPGHCICQVPSGGFPWWAILAGVGLAALAFAALYKQPCGGPQDEPCPQGSTCINGYCEPYTTTYQPMYTRV